ncbi:phage head completion protein [Chitinophaga rhizosphaerae]|uniref:phage head completion protein n=1 Tax=Chitinophaga rhizosphaerae TaxID=1864947 RepID=UPI000F809067|nr:head-tail adaptor protein [Chitinophaga rhizosphaerae]
MIGQMRYKATFQTPVATAVAGGGQTVEYTDTLTDWVGAKQVSSKPGEEGFQPSLGNTYRLSLRFRNGFAPQYEMLVAFKGGSFTITGIESDLRERFWYITITEKV